MRRVQSVALDLFEARGFGGVTIDEIAALAEVSAPTVYRHFGTKERLILWDEYDPLIVSAADEGYGRTLLDRLSRAIVRAVESVYGVDADRILRRARLVRREPALRQANPPVLATMREGLAQSLLASGASGDALEAEVVAGAVASALETAVRRWEQSAGSEPLSLFVRESLVRLGRLTSRKRNALEHAAGATRIGSTRRAEQVSLTRAHASGEETT